jgi:hypothetical protein
MPTPNEFSKIDSPRGPVPRDASEPEAVNRDDCLPVGRSDNFLFADDTPTDISCGSRASPTARTRLFLYWILLGREVHFLRQPLEFWLISYAIVRR